MISIGFVLRDIQRLYGVVEISRGANDQATRLLDIPATTAASTCVPRANGTMIDLMDRLAGCVNAVSQNGIRLFSGVGTECGLGQRFDIDLWGYTSVAD